ncbi:chymotrypsin-1-like [Phymastichus coffea]|uniref:chymotrypsin-1-like n=1 Tax=Phymastichus coffea TaxID=108790 RepID=UPI00273C2C9E|nr:chymotrypsin-1-like [Phymastichus coffea]
MVASECPRYLGEGRARAGQPLQKPRRRARGGSREMRSTLASLFCLSVLAGVRADAPRIVGGRSADISEFPYLVSLRLRGRHFCGGSIIDESHVLTAAHCIKGIVAPPYADLLVVAGSSLSAGSAGRHHRVRRVRVHEGYLGTEASSYKHDLAVITLAERIAPDANASEIALPSRDAREGERATVSGWGVRRYPSSAVSPRLQSAHMRIVPRRQCTGRVPARLYAGHVCAFQRRGVGACSGDSGGPLVVDGQLVGIASWVVPCAEGYPDVYTKVYAYEDWIRGVVASSR